MQKLTDFIANERFRFGEKHNNMFAFSFSEISRYANYLLIIQERYKQSSADFVKNHHTVQSHIKPGAHPVNEELWQLINEGGAITAHLHLEIESFYLFANILLDKTAKAIEFYFGTQSGKSLKSHRKIINHFEQYAKSKGLIVDGQLIVIMKKLRDDITAFRDYQITHIPPDRATRITRGTTFDTEGQTRMMLNSLYPTEKDRQYESKLLNELLSDIGVYIEKVIEFIEANKGKTALVLEKNYDKIKQAVARIGRVGL